MQFHAIRQLVIDDRFLCGKPTKWNKKDLGIAIPFYQIVSMAQNRSAALVEIVTKRLSQTKASRTILFKRIPGANEDISIDESELGPIREFRIGIPKN
jgi:hypothetical protein